MRNWRNTLAFLSLLTLSLSLLSACTLTPSADQVISLEPTRAARPPALAFGPLTRIAFEGTVNTGFGEAVGISGDTLVVGATDWNVAPGDQFGSVYVYQRAGGEWNQQARLTSSDGRDGFQYDQHFGRSVAIAGDTIVVGAPDADHPEAGDNAGAVYVFKRSGETWQESVKLEAAPPRPHERFGNKLYLDGNTLAVAGDQDDALYVFVWDGEAWAQQARLKFSFPPENHWRTVSLGLYGDILAAGVTNTAFFAQEGSGSVFVYQRQGDQWTESARLEGERDFGVAVALGASPAAREGRADTLAVGAGGDSTAGLYAGAVYVYGRQGSAWDEQAILTAPDAIMDQPFPSNHAFFGSSVALQGDLLLVLSRFSSAVFIYQGQGASWTDQLEVATQYGFGEFEIWPIAIDGSTVVWGTPGEFGNSAHVFDIFPHTAQAFGFERFPLRSSASP
jgi:hypothetical protein